MNVLLRNSDFDGLTVAGDTQVEATKLVEKDEVVLVHIRIAPGGELPRHVTPVDVYFSVLEGVGEIEIGNERTPVSVGDVIESVKDIPHGIQNTGDHTLRVLVIKAPRP